MRYPARSAARLCVFALFHHVLPRAYTVVLPTVSVSVASAAAADPTAAPVQSRPAAVATADTGLQRNRACDKRCERGPRTLRHAGREHVNRGQRRTGGGKFAAKFTSGKVVTTATSYQSAKRQCDADQDAEERRHLLHR